MDKVDVCPQCEGSYPHQKPTGCRVPNSRDVAIMRGLLCEARGWVNDCAAGEVPDGLSDQGIAVLVRKNYEGGWPAFVAASDPSADLPTIWALCARWWGVEVADKLIPFGG